MKRLPWEREIHHQERIHRNKYIMSQIHNSSKNMQGEIKESHKNEKSRFFFL